MKTKEELISYLSLPTTQHKITKHTYKISMAILVVLIIFWIWKFYGEDVWVLSLLWMLLLWKIYKLYKGVK